MWEQTEDGALRSETVAGDADIEIVVVDLALGPAAVRASAALLSEPERARARRFVFARDARRFIVGRARLRQLLAARLRVPPESVELGYGARGKPALANSGKDSLRFNLSHRDDLAVYALSPRCEVGIDVEAVRPLPDADALAAHFFSRHEQAAYRALDPDDRPLGFLQCWTRKEAVVKALGEGLSHPLDSFDAWPVLGPDPRFRLTSFSPAPGFVAAVATEEL